MVEIFHIHPKWKTHVNIIIYFSLEDKPSKFDLNEEWVDQEKIDHILSESDDDEDSEESVEEIVDPTKIPDDTHFFFILTKDSLFSLSHYSVIFWIY